MAVIPLGNPATPVSPIDSIEDLLRRARAGTWEVDLADGTAITIGGRRVDTSQFTVNGQVRIGKAYLRTPMAGG